MKRSVSLPLALFLLTAGVATAQVSERVNVSLIEVPVTVADGGGNSVRGLTKENFVVSDDRGAREVATFDVVDFSSASHASIPPAARRNFLLLFDLSNTTPKAMTRARGAAENFVKTAVHPSDLAAVGTISVEAGFRMVTAFTSDRVLLAAAIADPKNFIVADPLGLANGAKWAKLSGALVPGQQSAVEGRCFW